LSSSEEVAVDIEDFSRDATGSIPNVFFLVCILFIMMMSLQCNNIICSFKETQKMPENLDISPSAL
jgi:hypothetical protein